MMSTLVCTKCGEVRVETSRSVVLPYVCQGCELDNVLAGKTIERVESVNGGINVVTVPQYYECVPDLGPTSRMAEAEFAASYEKEIIAGPKDFETDALADDTATTESTIEMISDLEEQLTLAKELSQGQTELIEQLEQKITTLEADIEQAGLWRDLAMNISETMVDISLDLANELKEAKADANELAQVAHGLAFYYGYETAKSQRLETLNAEQKAGLDAVESLTGIKFLGAVTEV